MKRLVDKIRSLRGGFDRFENFIDVSYVINVNEDGYIHIKYLEKYLLLFYLLFLIYFVFLYLNYFQIRYQILI